MERSRHLVTLGAILALSVSAYGCASAPSAPPAGGHHGDTGSTAGSGGTTGGDAGGSGSTGNGGTTGGDAGGSGSTGNGGTTGGCTSDTDCSTGQVCLNGSCTTDGGSGGAGGSGGTTTTCSSDADCASGDVCVNATCTPDPGDSNGDGCSDLLSAVCHLACTGYEHTICVDPSAVPDLLQHGDQTGPCPADCSNTDFCLSDADCASGQVCDQDTNICVPAPAPSTDPGGACGGYSGAIDCAPGKTLVCHIPPGNPGNAHEICVGGKAPQAHLDHGDHLGCCLAGE